MRNLIMVLTLLFLLMALSGHADMVVIVDNKTNVTHISNSSVGDIFLDRLHTFDNGISVVPVNNNALMKYFYLRVADRNQNEMQAYWSKLLFTGRGEPPLTLDDDQSVIQLIEHNPNMVGYVSAASVKDNPNVKVIEVIPDDVYAMGNP